MPPQVMGMPVESAGVRRNSAEDTDIQPALSCRVQQVINRQTAEVIEAASG